MINGRKAWTAKRFVLTIFVIAPVAALQTAAAWRTFYRAGRRWSQRLSNDLDRLARLKHPERYRGR